MFKSKKLGLEAGSGKFRFGRLVPPKPEIGSEFFALGLIRLWVLGSGRARARALQNLGFIQ